MNVKPDMVQRSMVFLNQIDWRLRAAAGRNCRRSMLGTGIVLDSLLAYKAADRPALSALLGLGDLPQIVGIAAGSPGEAAGLAVGDRIVAVNGMSSLDLMSREGSEDILPENMLENIGAMPQAEPVRFEIERGGERLARDVDAIAICPGMIAVKVSEAVDAFSDSDNIAVTTGMVSKLGTPDEMAFVIGHELAHILFEDSRHHQISRIRKEDRADLYGVFLARCAGFDPQGAISALEKLKSQAKGRLVIPWIHHSFNQRQKNISSVIHSPINCEDPFPY